MSPKFTLKVDSYGWAEITPLMAEGTHTVVMAFEYDALKAENESMRVMVENANSRVTHAHEHAMHQQARANYAEKKLAELQPVERVGVGAVVMGANKA